jgi:hypothetical protein
VRDLRFDQRLLERLDVGERPLVEAELRRLVAVEQRDRKRSDLGLELVEEGVDGRLDLLGDDQLLALPHVGHAALGERLGELGALVEAPAGEVVVDLGLIGIVRVEVDVERRRRTGGDVVRLLLAVPTGLVDERHGPDAIPVGRTRLHAPMSRSRNLLGLRLPVAPCCRNPLWRKEVPR